MKYFFTILFLFVSVSSHADVKQRTVAACTSPYVINYATMTLINQFPRAQQIEHVDTDILYYRRNQVTCVAFFFVYKEKNITTTEQVVFTTYF